MHLLTLNIASNHVKLLAYKTEICGPMQLTFNIFVGKPQSAPLTVTTVRQFSLGNRSERSDCKKINIVSNLLSILNQLCVGICLHHPPLHLEMSSLSQLDHHDASLDNES